MVHRIGVTRIDVDCEVSEILSVVHSIRYLQAELTAASCVEEDLLVSRSVGFSGLWRM